MNASEAWNIVRRGVMHEEFIHVFGQQPRFLLETGRGTRIDDYAKVAQVMKKINKNYLFKLVKKHSRRTETFFDTWRWENKLPFDDIIDCISLWESQNSNPILMILKDLFSITRILLQKAITLILLHKLIFNMLYIRRQNYGLKSDTELFVVYLPILNRLSKIWVCRFMAFYSKNSLLTISKKFNDRFSLLRTFSL